MALWTLYHRFVGDQRYDRARPPLAQAVGRCQVDAAVATLIEEKSVCLPEPTWWSLLVEWPHRSSGHTARGTSVLCESGRYVCASLVRGEGRGRRCCSWVAWGTVWGCGTTSFASCPTSTRSRSMPRVQGHPRPPSSRFPWPSSPICMPVWCDLSKWTEVSVLGLSFGGAVAQQLAYQSPRLVRRLVLCGTGPGIGGIPGSAAALQELASPVRYYSAAQSRRVTPMIYGGRFAREPESFSRELAERLASPPSVYGYYCQLAALVGWSSLPWLGQHPGADTRPGRRRGSCVSDRERHDPWTWHTQCPGGSNTRRRPPVHHG